MISYKNICQILLKNQTKSIKKSIKNKQNLVVKLQSVRSYLVQKSTNTRKNLDDELQNSDKKMNQFRTKFRPIRDQIWTLI